MEAKIPAVIAWLLEGDVSVQYRTRRDLLDEKTETLNGIHKKPRLRAGAKHFLICAALIQGYGDKVFIPLNGYRRIIHCCS